MGSGFGDKKMLQDAMALASSFKSGGGKNSRRDHGFGGHIDETPSYKKRKSSHQVTQPAMGPQRVPLRNYPNAGAFVPSSSNATAEGTSLLRGAGMDFLQRRDSVGANTEEEVNKVPSVPTSLTTLPGFTPSETPASSPWSSLPATAIAPSPVPQPGSVRNPQVQGWSGRPEIQATHQESRAELPVHVASNQSQPLQAPKTQAPITASSEELFRQNFLAFAPPAMFQEARDSVSGLSPMDVASFQPVSTPQGNGAFSNLMTTEVKSPQPQTQLRDDEDMKNPGLSWQGKFNALLNAGQSTAPIGQGSGAKTAHASTVASVFRQTTAGPDEQQENEARSNTGQPAAALRDRFQDPRGRFRQALEAGKSFNPGTVKSHVVSQDIDKNRTAAVHELPGLASSKFASPAAFGHVAVVEANPDGTTSQGSHQQAKRVRLGTSGLSSSMFAQSSASGSTLAPPSASSSSMFFSPNQRVNSTFQDMNMDMDKTGGQTGGTLGPQLQGQNEPPRAFPWSSSLRQEQQPQNSTPPIQKPDSSTTSTSGRTSTQGLASSRWAS